MDLSRFPRRRYTQGPTPLEFLPHFTEALGGPNVWVKRDDMLGLTPGGNKTRKLEFLVADALANGADTLVTCGAPQSNHCRITLAAAVREGLKCRFVIEERVADSYRREASGNNFLFRLMGVEAITVVPGGSDMRAAMQKVVDELAQLGRKGYAIPGGGSNALGGLGYVACAQELQQQFFEQGVRIDRVVVGSGSSGTHGGLLAGFLGNHIDIPIVGIGVSRDPVDQDPLVHKEAQAVFDLLGVKTNVPRDAVLSFGDYWRPKYSRAQREDGRGGADAGAHRGDPARPGLHRKDHGRTDRSESQGLFPQGREPALHPHRWRAVAPRVRSADPWRCAGGRVAASATASRPAPRGSVSRARALSLSPFERSLFALFLLEHALFSVSSNSVGSIGS